MYIPIKYSDAQNVRVNGEDDADDDDRKKGKEKKKKPRVLHQEFVSSLQISGVAICVVGAE